jgi:hypothetical protein
MKLTFIQEMCQRGDYIRDNFLWSKWEDQEKNTENYQYQR